MQSLINQTNITDITTEDMIDVQRHLERYRVQLALKRFIDLVGASMIILLLSPILIAVAVSVKMSSPGPVFFTQERLGYKGYFFKFIKFRSMWTNWESQRPQDFAANSATTGHLHKVVDDPRVTPIGRWLRKSSLDEIPQLFNIINGSMSLVGPRPLMPHMLTPYPNFSSVRHLVRPGLTGLWQIRDRSNNNGAHHMIQHDVEYLKNFNVWLDIKIILETIPAVVSGRGAF